MWICPKCNRSFRNKNQSPSCLSVNHDLLFIGKEEWVKDSFEKNLSLLKQPGGFNVSASKNNIFLKHSSTFAAIKPTKSYLTVEFYCNKKLDNEIINKTLRISKNRIAHSVIIKNKSGVNRQLIKWIENSYRITA